MISRPTILCAVVMVADLFIVVWGNNVYSANPFISYVVYFFLELLRKAGAPLVDGGVASQWLDAVLSAILGREHIMYDKRPDSTTH